MARKATKAKGRSKTEKTSRAKVAKETVPKGKKQRSKPFDVVPGKDPFKPRRPKSGALTTAFDPFPGEDPWRLRKPKSK